MSEGKARSACSRCHDAKVKCDRRSPCARCEKKGYDCAYIVAKATRTPERDSEIVADLTAAQQEHGVFFAEHDKRVWAVFFALLKKFKHGCPAFWFSKQLSKMLSFLERRADSGHSAGLKRFKSWSKALSIELPEVSPNKDLQYHHFVFNDSAASSTSVVHVSVDELRRDALAKKEPILNISVGGIVEVNDHFVNEFRVTHEEMQGIISDAGGGFLPWGGDAIGRIASSERDLSLYMQSVAINFEQLGLPVAYPSVRIVPSAHVLKLTRRGVSTRCIIRAIQTEHINAGNFTVSSAFAFEFPDDKVTMVEVPPILSEVLLLDEFAANHSKKTKLGDEDHAKQEEYVYGEESASERGSSSVSDDDERWLDQLLSWAEGPDVNHRH